MKKFILGLILLMAIGCKTQDLVVDPITKGHAIGYTVEIGEYGTTINSNGRSMIARNAHTGSPLLEIDTEYNLVYEIVDRRDKTMIIDVVGSEISAGESEKRINQLMLLANHPSRVHSVGYVVEINNLSAIINSSEGSIIIKNVTEAKELLEINTEYNLVYEVIDQRGKTLTVNLIDAELSMRESARKRAKLLYRMR